MVTEVGTDKHGYDRSSLSRSLSDRTRAGNEALGTPQPLPIKSIQISIRSHLPCLKQL